MSGPVWVPLRAVLAIYGRQIARHGGAAGVRDMAPLESGCARQPTLPSTASLTAMP